MVTKSESIKEKMRVSRKYEPYIIECISWDGYDVQEPKTDSEKLRFLHDTFVSEYHWMIERVGKQEAFKEWLMGIPSAINIPFYNSDIIELAKRMGSIPENASEKEIDKILDNYWNFMANKACTLFKRHGIK